MADVCEIQIIYDNPESSELSIELPLDDEKFTFLQENDQKIQDLHDKVKEGVYNQFYFVNNNMLFRSIVDNCHKFEARVIPRVLAGSGTTSRPHSVRTQLIPKDICCYQAALVLLERYEDKSCMLNVYINT